MSTITGKSALITGGGSGIGLGCAIRLVQDGAHVTICGRTEDKLVAAVDVIAAQAADGATVRHIVADVTVEDEIAAANAFAAEVTGGLDILVANAGGSMHMGALVDADAEAIRATIDVNLTGTILSVKHAIAPMKAAGGGSVIAMCAVTVLSAVVYGHHMYQTGMSPLLGLGFEMLTLAGRFADARQELLAGEACEKQQQYGAALVHFRAAQKLDRTLPGIEDRIDRLDRELKAVTYVEQAQVSMRAQRFDEFVREPFAGPRAALREGWGEGGRGGHDRRLCCPTSYENMRVSPLTSVVVTRY